MVPPIVPLTARPLPRLWKGHASLEALLERTDLGLEVLHPGGLALTDHLADLAELGRGDQVLDVASGSGTSACHLAATRGCRVTGLDRDPAMVARARRRASERGLERQAWFTHGDAHRLPFPAGTFDAAISECAVAMLDKERVLAEMTRVVRRGGHVAVADLAWRAHPPRDVARTMAHIEGVRPETLDGWRDAFTRAGLDQVVAVAEHDAAKDYALQVRRAIGEAGEARVFLDAMRRWGPSGAWDVRTSARLLEGPHLGYVLLAGRKP